MDRILTYVIFFSFLLSRFPQIIVRTTRQLRAVQVTQCLRLLSLHQEQTTLQIPCTIYIKNQRQRYRAIIILIRITIIINSRL